MDNTRSFPLGIGSKGSRDCHDPVFQWLPKNFQPSAMNLHDQRWSEEQNTVVAIEISSRMIEQRL